MKLTKKEKLILDDLVSQLYGSVACHSSIDLANDDHKNLLEVLRKDIKNIKQFLEIGNN